MVDIHNLHQTSPTIMIYSFLIISFLLQLIKNTIDEEAHVNIYEKIIL